MCSIFAVFTNKHLAEDILQSSRAVLERSVRRGPDESHLVVIDGKVLLGSNRLRIMDLSSDGAMPLKAVAADAWISFNGEIYNFKQLRSELIAAGFRFRSETDTEVVLNAYLCWGESFVSRLNGIFAVVIYDHRRRRLIAARDRFGAKPLYCLNGGDFVAFGSDFLPLCELGAQPTEPLDGRILTSFMMCRFVPGSATLDRRITKLEPAEIQSWSLDTLNVTSQRFWRPVYRPRSFHQEEFAEHLTTAIKRTAVADVAPSLLLSGGLDSSAIAAKLQELGHHNVAAYSCAFKGSQAAGPAGGPIGVSNGHIDESIYAKEVAAAFGLPFTSFLIDADIEPDLFLNMQQCLGEPLASPNALGLYLLGMRLKGKTRLALAGTGADELLGGYESLYAGTEYGALTLLSNHQLLASFADFDGGSISPLGFLDRDLVDTGYLDQHLAACSEATGLDTYPNELLNQLLIFELNFGLPGWELEQADRLFMDSSIELRSSFLENEFVDYCLTIPSASKRDKRPLREAMRGRLPEHIAMRPKLPSLGTPMSAVRHKWFSAVLDDLLHSPAAIWDKSAIERLAKGKLGGISFDVLYRVIYLHAWLKMIHPKKTHVPIVGNRL